MRVFVAQVVKSVKAEVIRGVTGLEAKALEQRGQCLKVLDRALVKGKQMLTHQVSPLGIREKWLLVILLLLLLLHTLMIQDNVQDQVVVLLDGQRCRRRIPQVLLVWIRPFGQEDLHNRRPAIGCGIVQCCVT